MSDLKDLTNAELAARRRKLEAEWLAETDDNKARAIFRQEIERILAERNRRLTWIQSDN